jgi:hypothetical protein
MGSQITPQARVFSALELFCLWPAIVITVGVVLLRLIGKNSPPRRRQGRYVLGWMVFGWLVGACAGIWTTTDLHDYELATFGSAGFGVLIGWVIGMVHGGLAVFLTTRLNKKAGNRSDRYEKSAKDISFEE